MWDLNKFLKCSSVSISISISLEMSIGRFYTIHTSVSSCPVMNNDGFRCRMEESSFPLKSSQNYWSWCRCCRPESSKPPRGTEMSLLDRGSRLKASSTPEPLPISKITEEAEISSSSDLSTRKSTKKL